MLDTGLPFVTAPGEVVSPTPDVVVGGVLDIAGPELGATTTGGTVRLAGVFEVELKM